MLGAPSWGGRSPEPIAVDENLMYDEDVTLLYQHYDFFMNTRETLILHALQFKQLHDSSGNQDLLDHLLVEHPERADELTKNVCARIPLSLAEEMESIGEILSLNKRELITLAIRDLLDKAKLVIDEFDALPESEA